MRKRLSIKPDRVPVGISVEDFEKMMIEKGFQKREFDPINHPYAYRSWYYRNRKNIEISRLWHIKKPEVVWFKPVSDLTNKEVKE